MSTPLIIILIAVAYLIIGRMFGIWVTTPIATSRDRFEVSIFWIFVLIYHVFVSLPDWLYLQWAYAYYIRHNVSRAKNESFPEFYKRVMKEAKAAKEAFEKRGEEWDDVRWRPHQNR